ncbi:MAG: hypothetical protein J7L15_00375 [Clostridiales bacterium]|nr:hypothetical protein [Clostridiales bacterium]
MSEKYKEYAKKVNEELDKTPTSIVCTCWFKSCCPGCKEDNWISNYDDLNDNDMSKLDTPIDICKCYNCSKEFWISETSKEFIKINALTNNVQDLELREELIVVHGFKFPK